MSDAIDYKSFKDVKVELPSGVIHVPQTPPPKTIYPNPHVAGVVICFLITALAFVRLNLVIGTILSLFSLICLVVAIQFRNPATAQKKKKNKWRTGLFVGPNEIWLNQYDDRWISTNRSENIVIQYKSKFARLELIVSDKDGKYLQTMSLSNLNKGQALNAIEQWLNRGNGDPNNAIHYEKWLSLIEELNAYRRWLPEKLLNALPTYPYKTEDLRDFTNALKKYAGKIHTRNIFLTVRTIAICLLSLGAMTGAGMWNQTTNIWQWLLLMAPVPFYIWITQGRLRLFKQDSGATVFRTHFWWSLIVIGYAWALTF